MTDVGPDLSRRHAGTPDPAQDLSSLDLRRRHYFVAVAVGDDSRALLGMTSRVKFGPDAPEMTLHGARLYLLDDSQRIKDELVTFFVAPH